MWTGPMRSQVMTSRPDVVGRAAPTIVTIVNGATPSDCSLEPCMTSFISIITILLAGVFLLLFSSSLSSGPDLAKEFDNPQTCLI